MPLTINDRAWVLAERLYIHCHNKEDFTALLGRHGVEYVGPAYASFSSTAGYYGFMSDDDFSFAQFMQRVPTYKYLAILEDIVFDPCAEWTAGDNWNYYGEYIRHWYPELLDLLNLADVRVDPVSKTLTYEQAEQPLAAEDFLPAAFGDPYLDYMRKEVNEACAGELYLSVMFVSRKILETCVVRVMEVVFPKIVNGAYCQPNHELWYDLGRGRLHWLETLLDNLKGNAAAFQEDRDLILELVALVKPFKNETNVCVHVDYRMPDEKYIQGWRIPEIMNLVRKIFRKYCNP